MRILFATSEATPLAKTGGLADVSGALPAALRRHGHDVTLILPAYRQALSAGIPWQETGLELQIPIGSKTVHGRLLQMTLPDSGLPVLLVKQDDYFDRPELYTEHGTDYPDNCERFVFFCRAVLEAMQQADLQTEVLHCNDWQTGLLPAYLRTEYRSVPGCEGVASLLTIHNLAYQGLFWHWDMLLTGLDWKYFNWQQMEFYGQLNLLKTGLVFADAINTVSPTYAEEICSDPLGCGLEGVLQQRRHLLSGIVNGVDYAVWNPATDAHLTQPYGPADWQSGKAANKAALQRELGLPLNPQAPLLGFVGRLAEQKGVDLIAGVLPTWVQQQDAQWVILGSGQPKYQELLARLAERFPQKVVLRLGFNDPLAHRIEAAADLFLMPSRFEPCGLSQLYSLKYGTVPLVRTTGGLADTVVDCQSQTLASGKATGFCFGEYKPAAFEQCLNRAIAAYRQNDVWAQIVAAGLRQDWSWERSARQYGELYERLAAKQRQTATV